MPLISIIIAVNIVDEKFWKTIYSLKSQLVDWRLVEIIIEANIANCTMASFQDSFLMQHAKVTVRKDSGVYDAFNNGLSNACGEFIWFVGAGDILPDSSSLRQVCDNLHSDDCKNAIFVFRVGNEKFGSAGSLDKFGRLNMDHHQGMLATSSLFKIQKFNTDFKIAGDLDWFVKVIDFATIRFVDLRICEIDYTGLSKSPGNRKLLRAEIFTIYYKYNPTWRLKLWYFCAKFKDFIHDLI